MSETEAARTRRRWINIGEIVGILALVVSAASFWDSHREREAQVRQATVGATRAVPLVLTGAVSADHGRIDLRAAAPGQVIQTQTIHFPTVVRGSGVDTTGNPRIEAGWFDDGLRAALRVTRAKGRHRVAVGIETAYLADGDPRTDRAIYDIGYTLRPRFLRPDAVAIEGVSLVAGHVGADLQKRVDARFAAQAH
ncbi:MAG: hypothetical protein ACRYG4_18090 [Janthinobacterium lividum]